MKLKYAAVTIIAVVFTFLLHEFTHWLTGIALGYEMIMTLNTAYPAKGSYDNDWHYTLISATGPVITLIQSIVFYLIIRQTRNRNFYPFLFSAFYVELLSGIMNIIKPNDLGRISKTLELGLFTIPAIFVSLHLFLIYRTNRQQRYSAGFNAVTFVLILILTSVWILINKKLNVVLIGS